MLPLTKSLLSNISFHNLKDRILNMNTFKLGVIIGRFQPVHKAHLNLIKKACEESTHVLFLLGSANRCTDYRNPFMGNQRLCLIENAARQLLKEANMPVPHFQYGFLDDFLYTDTMWTAQVQEEVSRAVSAIQYRDSEPGHRANVEITLYGNEKDNTSYYLKLFPQWKLCSMPASELDLEISATNVRDILFSRQLENNPTALDHMLHPTTITWLLSDFIKDSDRYEAFCAEFAFIQKYKARNNPIGLVKSAFIDTYVHHSFENYCKDNNIQFYEPYYMTVDALVMYKGSILLIKRGAQPGKGLWALPGGFLNQNETLLESAIREVKEETRFALKKEWLVSQHTYDYPQRSLRGRTISQGFFFKVPEDLNSNIDHVIQAQFISGGDDAAAAHWVSIHDFLTKEEYNRNMFEDHASIIYHMLGRA